MPHEESSVDRMLRKGKDALGKFLDDREKVAKAKSKADRFLGRYMDPEKAREATNAFEGLLKDVAKRGKGW